MLLEEFTPKSQLITKETLVARPLYPVIDAHNHLGEEFGGGWCNRSTEDLLAEMDQADVQLLVDLDGGWGELILQERLEKFKAVSPERFAIFGGINWAAWIEQGDRFGEWAAGRVKTQADWGAQGLKIWKDLGLRVRDQHGSLVRIDDPRLDPIWATAGELNLPVLIHVADPVAFFEPLDSDNERWEELNAHPDWHFPHPEFPRFLSIIEQFENLIAAYPMTKFIGAHVGCYAENLERVGQMLEKYPNYSIDIAARIAELGRQSHAAREFFIRFQDRVVFGTDFPANCEWYRLFYRFLETEDENFNYDLEDPPRQGRWRVFGLNLPPDVLKKIYFENARRVINL